MVCPLFYAKFDGFEVRKDGSIELIDSKTAIPVIPARRGPFVPQKVIEGLRNKSRALLQNPEYRGVLEFPDEQARNQARRILKDFRIENLETRVRKE